MTGLYSCVLTPPDGLTQVVAAFNSDRRLAESEAFFCGYCGQIWGRICLGHLPGNPPWVVTKRGCADHDPIGGSFIYKRAANGLLYVELFASDFNLIPISLIRYELSIAKV